MIYIICIVLIPFVSLCFRWIFHLALISAGVSMQDVLGYLATVSHSSHRGRFLDGFIIRSSPEPERTKRLLTAHHLHVFLIAFCILVPFGSAFIGTLEPVMRAGAAAVAVIACAVGIGGIVFCRKRSIAIPTLADDFGALAKVIGKENAKHTQPKGGCLKLLLTLGLMVGIFFLIIHTAYAPMDAASSQQATDAMYELGLSVFDTTAEYCDAWNASGMLESAITSEEGSTRLDFFVFDSSDRALSVASQYRDIIRDKTPEQGLQQETRSANYYIYEHTESGVYYILYCVDSTLLYAYCGEADKAVIGEVLEKMGYGD